MFRTFWSNLSKTQKIVVAVLLQTIVIVILVLLVKSFTAERPHVEIETSSLSGTDMPDEVRNFVEENIWSIISSNVEGVTKNDIKDASIREGTYEEVENDDGSVAVSFIVDIDSLKQSYTVSTGWKKDRREMLETVVDCPPIDLMKYPDTVCRGAYHNTYSLGLYLPHGDYSVEQDEPSFIYSIDGNERTKTLNIMVSCDVDRAKKEAWSYLDSLPIDFSDYTINYDVTTDVDMEC